MDKERVGRVGATALAAAVAVGAAAEVSRNMDSDTAEAHNPGMEPAVTENYEPASARVIKCKANNKWYPLKAGQEITLRANAAVVPADVTVDGKVQYDNDADTSTVIGLRSKSKAGYSRTFSIQADYDGSMLVQKCKTSKNQFYRALGNNVVKLERRTGPNNPVKRVNSNVIEK